MLTLTFTLHIPAVILLAIAIWLVNQVRCRPRCERRRLQLSALPH
jgi:hypothetical protein